MTFVNSLVISKLSKKLLILADSDIVPGRLSPVVERGRHKIVLPGE